MNTESLWSKTVEIPRRPALKNDIKTEAAVIGAGLAGILTALNLKEHGIETVVIEASRIGGGQTKNTTAKITSQHGMKYDSLITKFGIEKARQYALANEAAVAEYHDLIKDMNISCGYSVLPAYLYSAVCSEPMEREAEAAASLGINAVFTKETTLPFPVRGAVRFENQAQFHPLEFLKAVSERLNIYENTRALRVEGHTIITPECSIQAEHIVFATHYPFINVPGYYFLRMHQTRSYALALENAATIDGIYYGVDNDGLSLRNAENYLILVDSRHRTGENSEGGKYEYLLDRAKGLFPDCREACRWSAQDCATHDGVPYIGNYAAEKPYWYVATGFDKWGVTNSMVSAMIIADMICGRENPYSEVFNPQRFSPAASAISLATDIGQSVKGLTRGLFKIPQETAALLAPGHGGIVSVNGEKAGVYKAPGGKVYTVDVRCPHLGCQLEWNPDELSWDCPCHGSRFTFKGELIDNPAQENLDSF